MIIMIALALFFGYWAYETWLEEVPDFIFGAILGMTIGGLVGLIVGAAFYPMIEPATVEEKSRLAQIADTTYGDPSGTIRGGAFLIRGAVSTDLATGFSYYVETDGGYTLRVAPADKSTIYYTDTTPRVEKVSRDCGAEKMQLRAFGFQFCNSNLEGEHYDFYVPKGSIVESFQLGGGGE